MSLRDFWEACKSPDAAVGGIIVCVGFLSFGLGRLSVLEERREGIRFDERTPLEAPAARAPASPVQNAAGQRRASGTAAAVGALGAESGSLVGSRAGTKYHFPWCSGAARTSEANKVWFASVEEARAAGYTPAANCKGLE